MEQEIKVFAHPTAEGVLEIRTGNAARPLDPYNYQGFRYQADSLNAFVSLVQTKSAGKGACVVFYNNKGYRAIMDDSVHDRIQSSVSYNFLNSVQFSEWADILNKGRVFGVPDFVKFLRRRDPEEIQDMDALLFAAQNFRYATNIAGDFTYDSRNNYVFMVKVDEAESTVRFPQAIFATVEIFQDSGWKQEMEIEIDIVRPKSADERPMIALSCPKFPRYQEQAKKQQHEELIRQLEGWLVVAGSPE